MGLDYIYWELVKNGRCVCEFEFAKNLNLKIAI